MSLSQAFPQALRGISIHLTGIKGTGMAALAEILVAEGAVVRGSDVEERFFTDELLERLGVQVMVGFVAQHIAADAALLIHSAAYGPDNPELQEARRRRLPCLTYTQALGALSARTMSIAVSGVHGKTTTSAMIGSLVIETGLPATVLVGSAVRDFGGSATLRAGDRFFIAETCEYRRHFLDYHPTVVLITSVELDHQDYFKDTADIELAFLQLVRRLPTGGAVVYCLDDTGATAVVARARHERQDLRFVSYGRAAAADYRIVNERFESGRVSFVVRCGMADRDVDGAAAHPLALRISGRHNVLNAVAGCTVMDLLTAYGAPQFDWAAAHRALEQFSGTRRRCEVVGNAAGVVVIDDYAHHPTAIRTTLAGLREFYPGARLLVSFMSHTYSRTAALFDQFVHAFSDADHLVLHEIYPSARETSHHSVSGQLLATAAAMVHPSVLFEPDFERAAQHLAAVAQHGDIVVTMGAGNNATVGRRCLQLLEESNR